MRTPGVEEKGAESDTDDDTAGAMNEEEPTATFRGSADPEDSSDVFDRVGSNTLVAEDSVEWSPDEGGGEDGGALAAEGLPIGVVEAARRSSAKPDSTPKPAGDDEATRGDPTVSAVCPSGLG